MSRRRKLKPATRRRRGRAPSGSTRARRTEVAALAVDDPNAPGERIVVLRSLRDDPLGALHAAAAIDQAQYMAGRRWQRIHECAELSGLRSIDPGFDRVDGGRITRKTVGDAQLKACAMLAEAAAALGLEGEALVRDVLAARRTLSAAAERRGLSSEVERKYLGRRFRECLDTLARLYGYAGRLPPTPASGR